MAKQEARPNYRLLHMGTEFAGATIVLALVGWFIDGQLNSSPYGALIGGGFGFVGGMYLFIKEGLAENRKHVKPGSSSEFQTGETDLDSERNNTESPTNFNDRYKL